MPALKDAIIEAVAQFYCTTPEAVLADILGSKEASEGLRLLLSGMGQKGY